MKTITLRDQVRHLPLISAAVFVVLAVLSIVLMKDTSYQVTLSHLTRDALASQNGSTVLAPAAKALFDVQLRVLLAVIMGISAIGMLLAATRYKKRRDAGLKARLVPGRWIYLAVTTPLMVEVVALLSGINDIIALKLAAGLAALSALLGWQAESLNRKTKKPEQYAFGLGVAAGLLPWLLIIASAIATYVYGMQRAGWYVYALYAVSFAAMAAFILNMRNQIRNTGYWKDYSFAERNYLVIDLLSKAAFTIILIIGVRR